MLEVDGYCLKRDSLSLVRGRLMESKNSKRNIGASLRELYLDLLIKTLTNLIHRTPASSCNDADRRGSADADDMPVGLICGHRRQP